MFFCNENLCFNAEDFVQADDMWPLGMHSLQKLPAMYAQCNNCTQEDIEICGWWHMNNKQHVSMHYVSTNLPYQDAKVASKLCMGGPVNYAVHEGVKLTNAWLLQHVVPHIAQHFPQVMLTHPILWACYDDQSSIPIPPALKN